MEVPRELRDMAQLNCDKIGELDAGMALFLDDSALISHAGALFANAGALLTC